MGMPVAEEGKHTRQRLVTNGHVHSALRTPSLPSSSLKPESQSGSTDLLAVGRLAIDGSDAQLLLHCAQGYEKRARPVQLEIRGLCHCREHAKRACDPVATLDIFYGICRYCWYPMTSSIIVQVLRSKPWSVTESVTLYP